MLGSTRFKKEEEEKEGEEKQRMEKLDFPHDEECPTVFGISNIVSHIRMESEVAWDGPRVDDVWRTVIPWAFHLSKWFHIWQL